MNGLPNSKPVFSPECGADVFRVAADPHKTDRIANQGRRIVLSLDEIRDAWRWHQSAIQTTSSVEVVTRPGTASFERQRFTITPRCSSPC